MHGRDHLADRPLATRENLGRAIRALAERSGEGAAALALRRTALEHARSLHGDGKLQTATCRIDLAETLLRLGHRQPALEALLQALPTIERLQVDDAPARRRLDGLLLLARGGRGRAA